MQRSRRPLARRPLTSRLFATAAAAALALGALTVLEAAPASAASSCGAGINDIACENSKPGAPPSEWDISGAGDSSIQGFSTDISVNVGSRIDFKIDTDAAAYTIAIYRTGWYQGLGARKIADVSPSATLPQAQPSCVTDAATELYDCGNWAVSASWAVPSTAVSGVYIALLTRTDTGDASHITFVVRNEASTSAVLFQTSDPTWQAYNTYGGADFYQGAANGRAYKLSYNRPVVTRGNNDGRDFYFSSEFAQVRFLERNGYDVSYFSGVDTDRLGGKLLNHRVFLSVGHDEYWSAAQRANVEAARDAGVNLQFLSGNEAYWHTRYEPASAATGGGGYRTLVSYKETWANNKIDPQSEWTGTWRDPRFASTSNGAGRPENGLTGTLYMSNFSDLPVTVSAQEGKLRLWRNTSLSGLADGSSVELAPHTIGYESDEDVDNGSRPPGLVRLSTTTGAVPEYLQDFGNTVLAGTTTHHLTQYRAESGALVFSAGSVQWAWGLDEQHDGDGAPADARMQQAQVNLLADMRAQPSTLMAGLVAATPSTDTTAPTATITTPPPGTTVPNGAVATVQGTATDVGGRVAGVEVSTDDGTSWHPASGTTAWSYDYVQQGSGQTVIRVRATDDSGNYAASSASRAITVTGPFSVFGAETPAVADAGDATPVSLGLRFTPTESGFISGVRFFKSAANTGTHTGALWDSSGAQLGSVTFQNETVSGWQTAAFAPAIAVTAGQTYVVSYWAPAGHYTATSYAFALAGRSAGPLTVAGGFGAQPAGVYNTNGGFPTDSYHGGNYYVDAVFDTVDTSPLVASGQWPQDGSSSVAASTTVGAVLSKETPAGSVGIALTGPDGAGVAGSTSYDPQTRRATFTPTAALADSASYTATITAGDTVTAGGTWSFTTAAANPVAGVCPCGLFSDQTVPGILSVNDGTPLTLGLRFASDTAGTVTGIRFYKAAGNTGPHTGWLYGADGTQLATVAFTNESTSGWQTAAFDQPISVAADTEYIVAYKSPNGVYSATVGGFGSGFSVGPLRVAADSGQYSYAGDFPGSRSSASYLVDVVFSTPAPAPVAVVAQTPGAGAAGVALDQNIGVTLSRPIVDGYHFTASVAGEPIAGTVSLSTDRMSLTLDPADALPGNATVDVSLSDAAAADAVVLAPQAWSFTTLDPATVPVVYSLFGDQTPTVASEAGDGSTVELGVAFSASVPGQVTGIRFYKGASNVGVHTGTLWSASGEVLASVTFAGETASGWQTASLGTPVELVPGETYVVSYLAPQGNYAHTGAYFAAGPHASGPLTAAGPDNGRYKYGGGMPDGVWNSTNYFVDVVFQPAG